MVIERVNLSIAGFVIQLVFHKSNYLSLIRQFKGSILYLKSGFILSENPSKIDYYLEFVERNLMIFKKTKYIYNYFYEQKEKNRIITFYYISEQQFEAILRFIIDYLLSKDGFILHCSASLIDGKANLFLGKSGAGKTTIVTLLNKAYPILIDDIGFIRKIGEKNFYFYQTPFLDKINPYAKITKNSKRYPLGRIFFLQKAHNVKLVDILSKNDVFNKLLSQIWVEKKINIKNRIKVFFKLVSKLPISKCLLLYFNKDSDLLIKHLTV